MGKLFKERAKGKKKKNLGGPIAYIFKNNNDSFFKILVFFVILNAIND